MRITRHRRWVAGIGCVILIGLFVWPLLWDGTGARAGSELELRVDPAAYDFGGVQRLGGPVQATFVLQYQGEPPLTIRRIWTS